MPDIEGRIAEWRRTLSAGCRDEVIDELESHLRDDVQRLQLAGETAERALEIAIARLGTPQALAAEFVKVQAEGPAWLPVRVANAMLLALAAALFGHFVGRPNAPAEFILALHIIAVTVGYSATLIIGALAVCYVATRSIRPLSAAQQRTLAHGVLVLTALATVCTTLGTVLGGAWAKDHLGRFWDWDPKETGAALVLAWDAAMILFSWRRPAAVHAAMLLAFAGNVVVAGAWFGPSLLAIGFHSNGSTTPTIVIIAVFGLAQLGLIVLGLAPEGYFRRRTA